MFLGHRFLLHCPLWSRWLGYVALTHVTRVQVPVPLPKFREVTMAKSLKKVREKLNARRNSHAATLKSLTSSDNPAGWKQPGSMKRAT